MYFCNQLFILYAIIVLNFHVNDEKKERMTSGTVYIS